MSNATATAWTQAEIDEIKIEDTLQVYMTWRDDEGEWEVDSTTLDGYALDSRDGIYTDYGSFDDMPAEKQDEWRRAIDKHLDYIDLTRALNHARAAHDGHMQGLLGDLGRSLSQVNSTLTTVELAADGGSTDDELEARYNTIEEMHHALTVSMKLLHSSGLISEEFNFGQLPF